MNYLKNEGFKPKTDVEIADEIDYINKYLLPHLMVNGKKFKLKKYQCDLIEYLLKKNKLYVINQSIEDIDTIVVCHMFYQAYVNGEFFYFKKENKTEEQKIFNMIKILCENVSLPIVDISDEYTKIVKFKESKGFITCSDYIVSNYNVNKINHINFCYKVNPLDMNLLNSSFSTVVLINNDGIKGVFPMGSSPYFLYDNYSIKYYYDKEFNDYNVSEDHDEEMYDEDVCCDYKCKTIKPNFIDKEICEICGCPISDEEDEIFEKIMEEIENNNFIITELLPIKHKAFISIPQPQEEDEESDEITLKCYYDIFNEKLGNMADVMVFYSDSVDSITIEFLNSVTLESKIIYL